MEGGEVERQIGGKEGEKHIDGVPFRVSQTKQCTL